MDQSTLETTVTNSLQFVATYVDPTSSDDSGLRADALSMVIPAVTSILNDHPEFQIIPSDDPHFPERLLPLNIPAIYLRTSAPAPPNLQPDHSIFIDGAKRASAYGREVAYTLAHDCAERNITVLSTLELGVPGAAARGTLQKPGPLIGVVPAAIDDVYPRSHRLLYENALTNACLISAIPPGITRQTRFSSLATEMASHLANNAVLVESDAITTTFVDLPRPPATRLFAIPGPITSPTSTDPNQALVSGTAQPVRSITDIYPV